ncbi:IPT/TIG domain-containing protein [Shewanella decolorationis]|uniref:IPT/TIG domain-containing protein n=1 Tax=Shewanella decolorationis TaxID=256839 RepID=A0A5B8QR64_9GAMM|nr:IPT/TIG domain-containing protein [Shewanella decolorationis]QDZ89140.2 IPT/TIG domain-containing protein [Shewanella decolorationis]GLR31954.1 hypothetical protein GCM10007922_15110 [Shewanella decolorationis]
MRLPHSALALSLITFLALPLFAQATTVTPTEHHGTWENKDEDGDGVPDELDDYPFDKYKSQYALVTEEEFNNNQDVANHVQQIPSRISGVVQQVNDLDFYQIKLEAGKSVTFLLSSPSHDFSPGMAVLDSEGLAILAWAPNYQSVGKYKRAIQVKPRTSGVYYLVINDKLFRGRPDFNYKIAAFFDNDVDAIDDAIEPAFGFEAYSQDTDNDGIYDGEEFYVFQSDNLMLHDVDGDGLPNWLDDDTDADGIKDGLEGATDLDNDGLAAFADLDADGNSVLDAMEVGKDSQSPLNFDGDALADFIDLDDDDDLILDINDIEPHSRVRSAAYPSENYKEIRTIYYLHDGQTPIKDVLIANKKHRILGDGLSDGLLVFARKSGEPINMPVKVNQDASVDFILPEDATQMYFVASNLISANGIDILYRNENIPIILEQTTLRTKPGSEILLRGSRFNEQTKVVFLGQEITPRSINPSELIFDIPNSAVSGELYVKNTYGKSNTLNVQVGSSVLLKIASDVSLNASTLSALSMGSDNEDPLFFSVQKELLLPVSNKGYDQILVFLGDQQILNAVYYGQSEITVDYATTAVSRAWQFGGIKSTTFIPDYQSFFVQTQSLPEVKQLEEYIRSHITQPETFNQPPFFQRVAAAGDAVNKLLNTL